jgi:hypothetical protein
LGRTDTYMSTLRPRLQSQAMLSLLQLRPHRSSVRRSSNMRLLRRATRDQALRAERSRRLRSQMPSLQRCPHGMEQRLPSEKERDG